MDEFISNNIHSNIGKIFVKHRYVTTYNGFEKSLIISAIQKYIRRGMFLKAIWCVLELDYFKILYNPIIMSEYLEKFPDRDEKQTITLVKGIQTNMINRLRVICVEDIGIGQPGICKNIDNLISKWEKSKRIDSTCLVEIVRILCSSKKLRFLSDLKSVFHLPPYYGSNSKDEQKIIKYIYELRDLYNIPQPIEEININTNNISIFYWISENMENILKSKTSRKNDKIWSIIKEKCPLKFKDEIDILHKWFIEGKPETETPLFLYQAILLSIVNIPDVKLQLNNIFCDLDFNKNMTIKNIDSFCNDKHVYMSGETSVARFAQEGAVVENENLEMLDQRYRNLYIHLKLAIDNKRILTKEELYTLYIAENISKQIEYDIVVEDEVDLQEFKLETYYNFIVRAQLNTSTSKSDTYFADDSITNDFVLVKGPLRSITDAENAIEMNNWKKENGLPYMKTLRIEMLIVNRWPEGVPLGYRNKVDRSIALPFLISNSTVNKKDIISNIVTYQEYKNLKKDKKPPGTWSGDTLIVNWFNINSHISINDIINNDIEIEDYILNLLARWIFGISDLADRNFLIKDGRVYSIDEEYRDRSVNFLIELKKNKCQKIKDWLKNNYEDCILPNILNWKVSDKYNNKLTSIKNKKFAITLFE